jgi:hypothetical protein
MVVGLAIAVQLLFSPFVRRRPLVLAVTAVAALACLFIGGEEVSWGQHIFFWQEPSLVTAVNEKGELSLHNMNKGFERGPRTLLEIGVFAGGLVVPLLCAYALGSGKAGWHCSCPRRRFCPPRCSPLCSSLPACSGNIM